MRPGPDTAPPPILVAGTGLAGLAAALALANSGSAVGLVGPMIDRARITDRRTTALFGGSVHMLDRLGVLARMRDGHAPLVGLRLIDDTGGLLRAPETLFKAEETGRAAFGSNFENAPLLWALAECVRATPRITWIDATVTALQASAPAVTVTLSNGTTWTGALVVGADGRDSRCRRDAGLAAQTQTYAQHALVTQFRHSKPHDGISTELHRRAGPLTTVPLPGRASSLVWVETPDEARRLASLPDSEFRDTLESRLPGLLGAVGDLGPRGVFPLQFMLAEPLAGNRVALVGEAAHVIPPIGAQGLNLGLRDGAWLADIVARATAAGEDPGAPAVLHRYIAARRADIAERSFAIDALNRSLLADLALIDVVRGAGVATLNLVPWLKSLVMERGIAPGGVLPPLLAPRDD